MSNLAGLSRYTIRIGKRDTVYSACVKQVHFPFHGYCTTNSGRMI